MKLVIDRSKWIVPISSSQGLLATVDEADHQRVLSAGPWFPLKGKYTTYATTRTRSNPVLMHRFILGVTGRHIEVDHADGNGLNNTRLNIRACTSVQNHGRMRRRSDNVSGYRGVSWCSRTERWMAILGRKDRKVFLGRFDDAAEAARAWDGAAREYFGSFAGLNFPAEFTDGPVAP